MKKYFLQIIASILCLTLCLGNLLIVSAEGETNTQGITFSAVLDTPTVSVSESSQTVVMRIKASNAVTVDGVGFTITMADATNSEAACPIVLSGIAGGDKLGEYAVADLETGKAGWNSKNYEDVADVTELAVVTFTIPANTAVGTYNLGFSNLELTSNCGTAVWEAGAYATATLTIEEATVAEGYTAGLSADTVSVNQGDTVSIKVNVSSSNAEQTAFNADEVVISYDSSKLAFNKESSTLGTSAEGTKATVKEETGKVTLENYGDDRSFETIYTLVFDTIATGTATISLDSAGFVNKAEAVKENLISATLIPKTVNLTINIREYTIVIPSELEDIIEGSKVVTAGSSYEFTVKDTNYTYEFSATENLDDIPTAATVTSSDGVTFIIDEVNGNLTINLVSKTPKSYAVSFAGDGGADVTGQATTATYGTDYTFTLPANTTTHVYSLGEITIGGTAYTGYKESEGIYTIPGNVITGTVVINVVKTERAGYVVSVTGEGAGIATGYATTATSEASYTLTVAPEVGYNYTVTATMGGDNVELTVDKVNNTYTIVSVTGNVVFTISRTVDTNTNVTVAVNNKVQMNEQIVYAVSYTVNKEEIEAPKKLDGKVPTYNGQNMYWSDNHGAYIYLVIGTTLSTDAAKAEIGLVDGEAVVVADSDDVNGTGKADASDAQLVWNMYNAQYSEFTEDVTMAKFIRADRNADYKIDTTDAVAIISGILADTATE